MSLKTPPRPSAALMIGWAALLLVLGVRYAEPILDGDLFWHMAYARQMLDRGTLIPDHSLFSWTPAGNEMIYCAWAGELVLYGLWEAVGPWSLFALRYLVVLCIVLLAARFATVAGAGKSVFTPLLLMLLVLGSRAGSHIKPELFSLLFLHVVLFMYFRVKLARLEGSERVAGLYAIPIVVALWVNVHGAFIIVAPFLAATAAGELLNRRTSPALAFSERALGHLAAGWILCGVAVLATPYGMRYPVQLVRQLAGGEVVRPDIAWNTAHRGVLDPSTLPLHYAEYAALFGILVVVLALILARDGDIGRRVDWSVLFLNAAYLALYLPQLRTTYVWPAVATYSAFHLLRVRAGSPDATRRWLGELRGGEALRGLAIGLMLFIGIRSVLEARYRPFDRSWLGFGIGGGNPVAEAEFLAAAKVGPRLYNLFDSGGYLLWRLDPSYKVMTDQRSFPYLSWFDDQFRFARGLDFESFLRKYPADVALIDFANERCLRNFVESAEWRLVFYGQTAAVFVRSGLAVPEAALRTAPHRFDDVRSPAMAMRLFDFSAAIGDRATAALVLRQMETRHRRSLSGAYLREARSRI